MLRISGAGTVIGHCHAILQGCPCTTCGRGNCVGLGRNSSRVSSLYNFPVNDSHYRHRAGPDFCASVRAGFVPVYRRSLFCETRAASNSYLPLPKPARNERGTLGSGSHSRENEELHLAPSRDRRAVSRRMDTSPIERPAMATPVCLSALHGVSTVANRPRHSSNLP